MFVYMYVVLGTEKTYEGTIASVLAQLVAVCGLELLGKLFMWHIGEMRYCAELYTCLAVERK